MSPFARVYTMGSVPAALSLFHAARAREISAFLTFSSQTIDPVLYLSLNYRYFAGLIPVWSKKTYRVKLRLIRPLFDLLQFSRVILPETKKNAFKNWLMFKYLSCETSCQLCTCCQPQELNFYCSDSVHSNGNKFSRSWYVSGGLVGAVTLYFPHSRNDQSNETLVIFLSPFEQFINRRN